MCFWNTDLSVCVSGVDIMAMRTRGMWKHMTLHLTSYSYAAPSGPSGLIPNWGQYRAHDPDDQRTSTREKIQVFCSEHNDVQNRNMLCYDLY